MTCGLWTMIELEFCATTYVCIMMDIALHSDCMAWQLGRDIP